MELKGYRGSSTLKRSNVSIQWTPELVKQYMVCEQDPIYFAENYMKIVNVDQGLITIPLYDYQKEIVLTVKDNRYTVAECARQSGKALDIETDIPTINGWKKMKDIQVGDTLFDMHGKQCNVIFKSETHNKPTYKITFSDNKSVIACEDHIWYGYDSGTNDRNKLKEFTTKQISSTGVKLFESTIENRYSIPISDAVEYNNKNLPIDPYVLGLWLGDGVSESGTIVMLEDDFENIKNLIPYEYSVKRYDKKNQKILYVRIHELRNKLNSLNLLKNKHIPQLYLEGSVEQRLQLLRGLMDTDGTVGGTYCNITQSLKHSNLLQEIKQLVASLGMKYTTYKYLNTLHPSETIRFSSHNRKLFNLKRKADNQKLSVHTKCRKRFIVDIELIETKQTQCIQVDSPTKTFLCTKDYIVTHNTTAITVLVLWYIIFNPNKTVAILANKAETAREILSRIQLAYEHLPKWLQQGVIEWNKGSFELENGSRVLAAATSSNNIRGYSINLLIIDEAAFIDNWDTFFTSVFPTISSGQSTKIVLVSTVNGLNHFYKITSLARQGKNNYKLISIPWSRVPERDEKWKQDTIAGMNFDYDKFNQEYENQYLGSSGTLIAGWKLQELTPQIALNEKQGIHQYEKPNKSRTYCGVADVSRGKGLDYSALQIIDVTEMPYKQVCVFRDNMTTPGDFAEIINRLGRQYNSCPILVEVNDIGQQTAETLYFDYEYESMLFTESAGKAGKRITTGASKPGSVDRGIRTTKTVKNVGCSMLKLLIEQNQLIINDYNTIHELSTFSKKNNTYEAEPGNNDDLVMCLVLFAWLTEQKYFKDLTDINTLLMLKEKNEEQLYNDLLPFGFIDDGIGQDPTPDSNGDKWYDVDQSSFFYK